MTWQDEGLDPLRSSVTPKPGYPSHTPGDAGSHAAHSQAATDSEQSCRLVPLKQHLWFAKKGRGVPCQGRLYDEGQKGELRGIGDRGGEFKSFLEFTPHTYSAALAIRP